MHIKRFTDIKESSEEESELESYLAWYKKEGYITHPEVPNKEVLLKLVSDHVQQAWDEFAENNHPLEEGNMKLGIVNGRNDKKYLEVVESYAFTDNELGIFFKCFTKAQFNFFSGREICFGDIDNTKGQFFFKPYIWSTVNMSFEYFNGGTNGASFMIEDKDDSVFYDILDKKWYTRKEYNKKKKSES